ncbi:MAG TPA: hypothetical protein VHL11_17290 [Phototrophicaceae bacterium]|jgi:hypothetical protein|nr:hypothetical protein [Phototrophicaceae bacterium]
MEYIEIVIGFDAREMSIPFEWTPERRNTFLIKQDIIKPLSVDTTTWDSIFNLSGNLHSPKYVGGATGLWADLDEIKKYLNGETLNQWKPYWVIAVTQFFSKEELELMKYGPVPVNPAQITADWKLLGYDIADGTLLSALTSMGGTTYQVEKNERFGSLLNQYHLFEDSGDADKFADWKDERAPLEGPFYVYGLYLIEEIK